MKSFAMFREGGVASWAYGPGNIPSAGAVSRRRLVVFCGVFLGVLCVGLIYTFARPAQYRAVARLQITPPTGLAAATPPAGAPLATTTGPATAMGDDVPRPLLGEVQVLTSRPLLEKAWPRLQQLGAVTGEPEDQALEALQRRLVAAPVQGTQVVELSAVGPDAAQLPTVVNTLIQTYTERLREVYRSNSADAVERAREEATRLEDEVRKQRARVQDFQQRYDIVSLEREEQSLLNRAKAMSTALSAANERMVKAEARLRSMQESLAAGREAVRSKDNPTLASMEQRASQLREELGDLERGYAPAYLAMDPQVRAKRARLAELEEQIRVERKSSQATAIAEAQEELASARGTASQLQQQMAGDRRGVQEFSLRFNEYKAMQEELGQLELLQRGAQEKVVRLEATEDARRPTVEVVEWAAVPGSVWYPHYGRDAAISAGAALGLALLAVWVVEYVRPRSEEPAVAMPMPPWLAVPLPVASPPVRQALEAGTTAGRLPAPVTLPREMAPDEVAALLQTAHGAARVAVAALLSGLSSEELLALRWEDVDRQGGALRIGGAAPRNLSLSSLLGEALQQAGEGETPAVGTVMQNPAGQAPDTAELDGLMLCSAHDAGLEAPAEVTAAALRHTYLAYLVRQGARFADLPSVVGPLPVNVLAEYSRLAPAGMRVPAEGVEWRYPCKLA